MGEAATLISIAPHGLGCEPLPGSIQEMATDRLREILALQPTGPFRLGGHCNGGTVAFEVARLLQAQGHRVELLALIDVPAVNAGWPMRLLRYVIAAALALFCRNDCKREELVGACMTRAWLLYERTHRLRRMTRAQRREKLAAMIRVSARLLRHRHSREALQLRSSGIVGHSPQNDPMNKISHYVKALAQYFPGTLEVPIVYYSAEHSGHFMRRVSSKVEIKNLRADHFSCITTHLHLIARHLRERLNLQAADPATITQREMRDQRRVRVVRDDRESLSSSARMTASSGSSRLPMRRTNPKASA
jgi:thioesterase domain-containing protein